MFMSNNRLFLDSSILVEYVKGSKTDLLDHLLNETGISLFISQIVISEFYFHALAAYGGKSPLSLKMSGGIGQIMQQYQPQQFLQLFNFLTDDAAFVETTAQLMEKHNLLPNDALIIANCQHHNIKHIASYDLNDLTPVCKAENMVLISSVQDVKTAFSMA
jgi:uncharacterized protein